MPKCAFAPSSATKSAAFTVVATPAEVPSFFAPLAAGFGSGVGLVAAESIVGPLPDELPRSSPPQAKIIAAEATITPNELRNFTSRVYRTGWSSIGVAECRTLDVLLEAHTGLVPAREHRIGEGPVDPKIRIVPGNRPLGGRRVVARALVLNFGELTERREGVAEAIRHPDLAHVVGRQFNAEPLPKGWRTNPQVDRYIEHRAESAADKLAHRRRHVLVVQPPQHFPRRAGVVVLHERVRQTVLTESLGMPGLD